MKMIDSSPARRLVRCLKTPNLQSFTDTMQFSNYLLNIALPDENLEKVFATEFPIYITGVNKILSSLVNEIKENTTQNSLQLIASELKNDSTSVRCWLTGYNPTPILKAYKILKIWKSVCGKTEVEFETKWDFLFQNVSGYNSRRMPKVKLTKSLSNDLAYVIGFFLADGHIKNVDKLVQRGKYPEYTIAFYDKSADFLKKIEAIFVKEFSAKCNLHYAEDKKGSWYCLRCTSKPIHRFFIEVLGLPFGYKQGRVCAPEIIKQASVDAQKEFISGFCDGEGCVGISTKNPYFEVAQVSYTANPPEILVWVSQKLNEFGVKISVPQKGVTVWRIRTASQKVINNYYTIISSRHVDKIPKFEEVKRFSYGSRSRDDDRT
ncbi:MAG: LAGLIDADG family homing endonuclease [archaeon]|jgi:hypothetical protein